MTPKDPTRSARGPLDRTRDGSAPTAAGVQEFGDAVRFYLQSTPRQLPSRFLYDGLGSSLFDAICRLPWYTITRAELRLIAKHAHEIGRVLGRRARVVELGSGNGEKLAALLTHAGIGRVHAHLVDLSDAALRQAMQTLGGVDGVDLSVTAHRTTYEEGLLALPRDASRPTLVAFLGSNVGNFDLPGAAAFLREIRAALQPGDFLLLGADLVKPESDLLLAYDDPLGVTAAFNRNLLVRINAELDGDFQLDRFRHRALWNAAASRIEMHLVSTAAQEVRIGRVQLRLRIEEEETIWTESSYKYEPRGITQLVGCAPFVQRIQWIDDRDQFALTLFEAA